MKKPAGFSGFLRLLSFCYLCAAVWLLLTVCGFCYSEVETRVKQVFGGWEQGTFQEAFGTLSDGLEAGLPVGETVSASIEVLLGDFT